jgi:hypothetical protein
MSLNNIQEIEAHLKKINDSIQRQGITHGQLNTFMSSLQQQIASYKSQADTDTKQLENEIKRIALELKSLADSLTPRYKDIEDIPGIRTPKWYEVDIDFTYNTGANTVQTKSIEINPEGPFVITQITPVWEITDDNPDHFSNINDNLGGTTVAPTGRILPCTAFPMIVRNLGITNSYNLGYNTPSLSQLCNSNSAVSPYSTNGPLKDVPEFNFQIEIAGSGRYWTNQPMPAAAFFGYAGQPMYMGVQGWVERTDRIIIHATPKVAIPHDGRVRFTLHGYQILGHISISEALGY